MKTKLFVLTMMSFIAVSLSGCDKIAGMIASSYVVPKVNRANCETAAIMNMPVSTEQKSEFATLCARGGSYSRSPEKSY